jgi:hypothetical protein
MLIPQILLLGFLFIGLLVFLATDPLNPYK